MTQVKDLLNEFSAVAASPKAELDKHIASGKKVVGVGPYYLPEELVYAAGAIPFGVWGRTGSATEARAYFPPFFCSMCQMTLEMGLNGELDELSAMMVSALCDTLRGFSQNFRAGVPDIPMIFVSQPQNRKTKAGLEYATTSYRETAETLEKVLGCKIADESINEAIDLYNDWRTAMRRFLELAAKRPALVSVADRSAVVNSGYYMDKREHLDKLLVLNELLEAEPESLDGYKRIVLSGIMYDIPEIIGMLDDLGYAVVADDIAKESRALSVQVPEGIDPIDRLAKAYCAIDNDSILYDAEKKHVDHVAKLATDSDAQAVILLLAKFCDPEEFDAAFVTSACQEAGVPCFQIEVDQSSESYEQARTKLESLSEMLG